MYPFVFLKAKKGQAVCFKGQEKKVRNKKKLEYRSWHTRTTVEVSKID